MAVRMLDRQAEMTEMQESPTAAAQQRPVMTRPVEILWNVIIPLCALVNGYGSLATQIYIKYLCAWTPLHHEGGFSSAVNLMRRCSRGVWPRVYESHALSRLQVSDAKV